MIDESATLFASGRGGFIGWFVDIQISRVVLHGYQFWVETIPCSDIKQATILYVCGLGTAENAAKSVC